MGEKQKWQGFAETLKQTFGLQLHPVGVRILEKELSELPLKNTRICRGILDAAKGESLQVGKKNNACFGAAWHLGFVQLKDEKIIKMIKNFVVEGEKLFCSYPALDNLISQMTPVEFSPERFFLLAPLEEMALEPELVVFVCNPAQACRLLTMVTFLDGKMPKIKIGGPTCRLILIEPILTGETNISFYDYTSRKMCNVDADKLLVSIPYKLIPSIVENIDKCTAGTAKMEYSPEFRAFLNKIRS